MTTRAWTAMIFSCLVSISGCGDGDAADSVCGDGTRDSDEQCDDGNTADGDGCSAECAIEIPPGCGDGVVSETEQCDGGGETVSCDIDCTVALCGDAIRNATAGEACDDGNTTNGDGCSDDCYLELPAFCGDGNVNEGEQCDDGNTASGDGCSADCQLEAAPGMCGVDTFTCGGSFMATTSDPEATTSISSYSCLPKQNKSGPEMIYEWTADRSAEIDVWLEAIEGTFALDVIVVEAGTDCGVGACVGTGMAGATFSAVEGRRYLIIVDTDVDAFGSFLVGLYCP